MNIVLVVIIVIVALILSMQLWMRLSARKQRGQAVPEVGGVLTDEAASAGRQLYYFFSPSCGPCRTLSPIIDNLAGKFPGVIKVDITQQIDVARKFSVRATPTVVLVEGDTIKDVLLGVVAESKLHEFLAQG